MEEKSKKDLAKEVIEDFRRRKENRKALETAWQMDMNFYMGNQYCVLSYGGNLKDFEKQFFWQQREVFNHIAPIVDVRIAKLNKVRPSIKVLPASNDEADLKTAKVSKKVLDSASNSLELGDKLSDALKWSEILGTVFYKITWNSEKGQTLAKGTDAELKIGDVDISVCSPFEIYPDSDTRESIDDCSSIIHARVYTTKEVEDMYNIQVQGKTLNVFSFDMTTNIGGLGYEVPGAKIVSAKKSDSVLVLERYEKPTKSRKNGRLTIVAGEEVVYDGDLPYENGTNKTRTYPFVRQVSIKEGGSFWGRSIIDRLIPVQRAYNAVKNRKHEYLNRLSMGILKVEDGSVDIDDLEDEGLCPGKILVYRQGAKAPEFLSEEEVPNSFSDEEEKLLEEFKTISGVSEIRNSGSTQSQLSGTALELMIEQEDLRLTSSAMLIKEAVKAIAKHILRLYRQFASFPRLNKIVGENGSVELYYFSKNDISSDDIAFETESELSDSISSRRQMIFDLLHAGILNDQNGELSGKMKAKILESLGFGVWENSLDLNELAVKKAESENLELMAGEDVCRSEIDDDKIHKSVHTAFMLSKEFRDKAKLDKTLEEKFLTHLREHNKNLEG